MILIPDAAHGTNPASSALCGFESGSSKSNSERSGHRASGIANDRGCGGADADQSNTLGLFERNIEKLRPSFMAKAVCFTATAAMPTLLGKARPGDLGFDVSQLNLHKTFRRHTAAAIEADRWV